jgi:hypothetical protein
MGSKVQTLVQILEQNTNVRDCGTYLPGTLLKSCATAEILWRSVKVETLLHSEVKRVCCRLHYGSACP